MPEPSRRIVTEEDTPAAVAEPGAREPAPQRRLVVFSDDWGRHPSSCQRIMRDLAGRYRIDWVNTAGTRRPRLTLSDLKRAGEKIAQWTGVAPSGGDENQRVPDPGTGIAPGSRALNLSVHAPLHWPGFRIGVERALNRWLLRRGLHDVLPGRAEPVAVVTTLPITADLARTWPRLNWIYYCVDDLAAWPGLDAGALQRMELEQLGDMRAVIAASTALRERMKALGRDAHLLTHGVDIEQWHGIGPRRRLPPERPVALFWGLADRRLDAEICLALARDFTLRLVGPRQGVDARLQAQPGIVWEDAVAQDQLPRLAGAADVLVMPYADLPVTRAMQPLKLLEYLATDLPVIATPLPANREWGDALDLAKDAKGFAAIALERARTGLPPGQRAARARIAGESWSAKAAEFERLCLMTAPRE